MFSRWCRKLFLKPRQSTKTSRTICKVKPWTHISLSLEKLEDRLAPATLDWVGVNTVGSTAPGLVGTFYNINPGNYPNGSNGSYLIDNTNSAWLGNPANNYTVQATAVLTGAIDFPNISANGFQDNTGTTYYDIPGNNNNVEGRWVGQILIPGTGTTPVPINFATTSDDGSDLYIDGNLVVNNNMSQGATQQTGLVSLTPGLHNIDIEYFQGGGGASLDVQWDPTGGTNFVDIPNSVFSIPSLVGDWSDPANWVNAATQANAAPQNGDTVVFNSTITGSGAYDAVNDLTGLTLNGIIVNNTGTTPYVITGNAVTITNTDPTLTNGISDVSTTETVLGLTSITLGANTNIDNTSAFPASVTSTPSLLITANIDMAGHVLSSGPSLADAGSGTPDTGLTEIGGVVSSSVPNTDAVVENGYGALALAGNNTYDGTTSVYSGLLVAAANNSLGATTSGAKTVNPNLTALPSSPGAALGIALGGDNAAYTNGVTIQGAGPSVLGGALWSAATATTPAVFNAPITLAGATTFNISSGGSLSLGGPLNLGTNALTLAGSDNLTLSGVITGSAASSITDTDTATTTLMGNNAPFLGSININAGILAAGANNALGVGTGAVTVANGAALGFTNNVTYTTAQPVTITGPNNTGFNGNGAVESLSGTNSFAGTITVSSGDEYLGAIGGSTTLTTPVNLATNNLFLVGSGGNLSLSGAITGPSTSTITKNGTGTDTISHNNSATFLGSTIINQGVLAVSADGALGNGSGSVTVNSGGGLGFSGGFTYATAQPVSIIGAGTTGNGAIENLSGANSFAGAIALAGNSAIGSDASTLTLSGNITLNGWTLTATGAGNTTVTGIISGTGSSSVSNALSGAYFASSQLPGNTPTDALFGPPPAPPTIGSLTPSAVVPTAQINFPNIATNSFAPYANVGGTNVAASWTGYINITQTGTYDFQSASDDDSVVYIASTPGLGQSVNYTTPVVNNTNPAGGGHGAPGPAPNGTMTFTATGLYAIEVDYWQGSGGASEVLSWDPTGMNNFVVIPASAFSFNSPGTNNLVKTGSGTLTLSNANTYMGTTTINAGIAVAANNNAFGPTTGGGVTVNSGGALGLPASGGITLPAAKALTLNGAGPAGNGAIENLGSNNAVAGNITLASNASVGSDLTVTPVTVPNFSFETPAAPFTSPPATNPLYWYNPTGATWNFAGNSGIAANGSGFGPPNAPNGSQAAFLQSNGGGSGSISQSITFPAAGEYILSFAAAGRNNAGPNPFQVLVDGTQIGSTITPTNNVYATYSILFTITSSGAHTLTFMGLGNGGNDVTSFIDDVVVGAGPATPDTLTLSGNVTTNGNTLTATGTGNTIVSGVISGNGSLTKTGIGTLTLSNINTYLGATTINAGFLTPTVDGAMGPATAAGITVNAGGALALSAGLTYATAEPTTISGSGPTGAGAIVSLGGATSFAAPITLAANATIGAAAGTLTLTGGITGNGTLGLIGPANTIITGGINLTTGDLDVTAAGGTTLSGPITMGTGNVNLNGPGTTTISGSISFTGSGNLSISSAGVTNISGAVTLGSPASGSVLLSGSGPATLSGAVNLGGGNVVDTGSGQEVISGNISGSVGSAAGFLNGQYYNSGVTNAELSTLSALTPAVSEVLTGSNTAAPNSAPAGSMINLTDISQAANDSFTDALTLGGAPGPNFQPPDNIGAIWSGSITIPATAGGGGTNPAPITFLTGSDDGSTVWIDGAQVVFNDNPQGVTYRAGIVNLVPGSTHSIIITYYQGGGGASMFLNWDLTGATPANYDSGNPAGVPIPSSAFSIPGDTVTMNGSGTLTLSGNNSYIGQTSVDAGTLMVASNNALGTPLGMATFAYNGTSAPTAFSFGATTTAAAFQSYLSTITSFTTTPTVAGSTGGPFTLTFNSNDTPSLFSVQSVTQGQAVYDGTSLVTLTAPPLGSASGTTVAAGARITFPAAGGLNYTTAEPVTINGSGIGGNGAIENVSGANTFGGVITLGGNATIGSDAGTLTLSGGISGTSSTVSIVGAGNTTVSGSTSFTGSGSLTINASGQTLISGPVNLGTGNLTDTGAGLATVSGIISDSAGTGTVIQNSASGTMILSGNNTYGGLTSVLQGTLIAASNNALGSTASGTVVAANATLGIEGGITLAAEPLTISGSGVSGVGALANLSGNNIFPGPISLAADGTIGSPTAGNTLTLGGSITNGNAVLASNLTFTGAGNVTVNGAIQTSPTVAGLLGNYYSNLPGFNNSANQNLLITSTNPAWLGNPANNYVPGATALLTGAIDFPNIAANGFTDNLGTTYVNFGNNNMNVDARWIGTIDIPNNGVAGNPISFGTGSDDGSVIYIDGNLVVNNNNYQGVGAYPALQVTNTVDLTPGPHTIDIEYYNGGGGAAMWAQWDPMGGTTFVDIPNSVFSYQPPGIGNVVKNGSGTVTLASTTGNTYTGSTTINGGVLQVGADNELGATAGSTVTINAGTLEAMGTYSSTHNYVVGSPSSTIQVDASHTLTIPNAITGSGNLNKTGPGTLALTAVNTYSGGTMVSQGTLSTALIGTLGNGTVTMAGGLLSLGDNTATNIPLALSGFNQDVIWTASELTPALGTTTSFDGAGNVLYDTTVFSPGGGLPASGSFVSQSNPAVPFQLQPYTANNVLLATSTDTTSHTLTLSNPAAFNTLSLLDAAAGSAAVYNLTLNFSDGSSDSTSFTNQTAQNWLSGTGYAIGGLGEVLRTSPTFSGLPTAPGLFEQDLTLPTADQSKVLTSLTFTRVSGGALGIFAVDGSMGAQNYVNKVVVTANSTIDVENEPATLGALSIGSQTLSVTTAGAATSLTLGATTLTGNPTFSPGANTSLTLGALNDGGAAKTITVTGPTTLVAPATSVVTGTTVDVTASVLNSNNATALGTLATVAVSTGASFNLGASQTIGALSGAGTVNLDGNILTVGSTNNLSSTFSGAIVDGTGTPGSGGLVKAGSGTLTIAASSTDSYTGPTTVSAGKLQVDGNLSASTATVSSGATLSGDGTVNGVSAASGGIVSPGDLLGTLTTTSSFSLATGAIFQEELGGTTASTQYNQLTVSSGGTATLNSGGGAGATLNIVLVNGFFPSVGNTFTIINNQGANSVAGTFVQGSTYSANGYTYAISYTGGTNNHSVVLTVMAVPGPVTHFQVVASPSSITAGGTVSYTVTAEDSSNNIVPTYTGTVIFSSSDSQATFTTTSYSFTSGGLTSDDGVHTFTNYATLKTAGNQTINVADSTITGSLSTSNAVTVTAGAFSKYVVSIPGGNTVTAGSSFLFTVQAADPYGNTVSSYSGPSSVAVAVSPANSPGTIPTSISLNSAGLGFSLGTLTQVGSSYTLNVTGTQGNNTYTGTSSAITVTPAAATHFVVTAPSSTLTLNSTSFTVTAEDQYNNVATGYSGTVAFTSSDGAVSAGSGLPVNSTLVNGTGTFTATLKTPGNQTITATDASNSALVGNSNTIATRGLYVSSFATTPSGFTATFSKVVNLTTFDYYRFSASQSQAPDVAMATVGSATTNVDGTLLVSSTATQTTITFVATQGVLTNAAKYFVTLTSGAGGIVDTSGEQLAGDANGFLPGTNYVATNLAPASSTTPTLSIPGFARGPNSSAAVQITTNSVSATGIPITLTHAPANTTEVQFTLDFNPALLNVTGPTTGAFTLLNPGTANSTGVANFEYNGPALSTTSAVLGDIVADVPNSAANQMLAKTLLDLPVADIFFNGSGTPASPVQNADGVQVVDYLGETTNNFGVINSVDASNAQAVVTANTTPTTANQPAGLQAFPLADPYLIAGSTGSTTFKVVAADVTGLNRFAVSLSHPFIPTPPTGLTYSSPGPDPTVSLPTNLQVTAGGIVTVPVDIDDPRPAGSDGMTQAELALTYNPAVFSLTSADVQLGTVPASGTGWTLTTQINPLTGQIAILLESQTPIRSAAGGSLVSIDFHVNPGATLGATPVNLAASVNPTGNAVVWTRLFDSQQEFTLSPAPSNTVSAAGLDAMVVVTPVDAGTAEGAGSNLGAPAEIGSVISAAPTLLPELTAAVAPLVVPEEDKQGIAAPVDGAVVEGQTVHASSSADRTGSSVLEAVPFSANAGTTAAYPTSGLLLPLNNTALFSALINETRTAQQVVADQFFLDLTPGTMDAAYGPLVTGVREDAFLQNLASQVTQPRPEQDNLDSTITDNANTDLLWLQGMGELPTLGARYGQREVAANPVTPQGTVEGAALDQHFAPIADDTDQVEDR